MADDGFKNYQNVYSVPKPYLPDVAVIGDPISGLYVREDIRIVADGMAQLRNYAMKAGASTGYYTVEDFISGLVPQCPVYVFANTYYLTDGQIVAINQRLDAEGTRHLAVRSILGPSSSGAERTSQLTGSVVSAIRWVETSDKQWGLRWELLTRRVSWCRCKCDQSR
jgi:hypothetical protein